MSKKGNAALAARGYQFVIAAAGGGQQVIGGLLKHGGMAGTLLNAHALQARGAVDAYLGATPERYASEEAARRLAMRAYQEARVLSGRDSMVFGVGAASALASAGEREGRTHAVHVAVQTPSYTHSHSFGLKKARTRVEEEKLASRLIRRFTVLATGLWPDPVPLPLADEDDASGRLSIAEADWYELLHAREARRVGPDPARYVLSSSCNPLHEGHVAMMEWVETKLGYPVDVELCVRNADKMPLDYVDVRERRDGVDRYLGPNPAFGDLQLTNPGLFADKAALFPGATFLVGTDTLLRLNDVKFAGSKGALDAQFKTIRDWGCRFLVFPREGVACDPRLLNPYLEPLVLFAGDGYTPTSFSSTGTRKEASRAGTL